MPVNFFEQSTGRSSRQSHRKTCSECSVDRSVIAVQEHIFNAVTIKVHTDDFKPACETFQHILKSSECEVVDCTNNLPFALTSPRVRQSCSSCSPVMVGSMDTGIRSRFTMPTRGSRMKLRSAGRACFELVSIHARARRATSNGATVDASVTCFNPRPRAAGDRSLRAASSQMRSFQSTPARGGRHARQADRVRRSHVSIHARARRATLLVGTAIACAPECFNPRPRAAGDSLTVRRSSRSLCMFQSTPARGGRPSETSRSAPHRDCFNPRPRAAGDVPHASSATSIGSCFNPRPRAAGDDAEIARRPQYCFNPRPRAAGDDVLYQDVIATWTLFQSTPARGGRRPSGLR